MGVVGNGTEGGWIWIKEREKGNEWEKLKREIGKGKGRLEKVRKV